MSEDKTGGILGGKSVPFENDVFEYNVAYGAVDADSGGSIAAEASFFNDRVVGATWLCS